MKRETARQYLMAAEYCQWTTNRCASSEASAYCCEQVYGGTWLGQYHNPKCTVVDYCSRDHNHNDQCWGAGCNKC